MSVAVQRYPATARRTPYSVLDVVAGSAALSSMADRAMASGAEGALLDMTFPQAAALASAATAARVWVWTDQAPGRGRPTDPAAPVVVLDRRDTGMLDPDVRGAVVLRTSQVPAGPVRSPLLLDLPPRDVDPPLAATLRGQPAVAGFHVSVRVAIGEAVLTKVRAAVEDWHRAGRTARPLLVVRGASLGSCRMLVAALRRLSNALRLPAPRVRVDVSAAVLTSSSTTYVRVLTVSARPGRATVLDLDGLPPLDRPLHTAGHGGRQVSEVMFRHSGRVASGSVLGPVPAPGTVLVARGWLRRFPSTGRGPVQLAHMPPTVRIPAPRPASSR